MAHYFAYGSNMNMISLRAKGVEPQSSELATLHGWRLAFDVHHWFRHEGGVGNIHPSDDPTDRVQGIVHECSDRDLARLDAVESRGVGYDRADVRVETHDGTVSAIAYVGVPSYLDARCLPTQRYLNILVRGAVEAGLDAAYISALREHPVHVPDDYPPFEPPSADAPAFDRHTLADHPMYTALDGAVFDMSACRPKLECVRDLFGGKDMTLFHLKRLDSSDGTETLDDIAAGRVSAPGRTYLNAYLNEYATEFRYAGRYVYDSREPEEDER
jgi:sulfite reductase (NADPH) flavoprotein alpha-component